MVLHHLYDINEAPFSGAQKQTVTAEVLKTGLYIMSDYYILMILPMLYN